mgnify:CR=1 FL=1
MSLTPNDVVFHLQRFMPSISTRFSTQITGTATALGTTVTVTAIGHGLIVGSKIVVSGGAFSNTLVSVVDNLDGTVRFETDQEHDLTEPKQYADPTQLTLSGFGNVWDGAHDIVAIPNRKFFEIAFPVGETVLPVLGTGLLIEPRSAGILGEQTIATVPGVDTFTFDVTGVPSLPTGVIQGFGAVKSFRIFAAADFERATDLYNKQAKDEYALFVIMGDVTVSKDRHTSNDAIGAFASQNFLKQTNLNNFSTAVFIPTKKDIAGNDAQQVAYGEMYKALLRALYGFQFEDPDTALTYVTVSAGHGAGLYNSAYYVHVYDWQRPDVISADQGFNLEPEVAFRNINGILTNFGDPEAPLSLGVNLDDEPL